MTALHLSARALDAMLGEWKTEGTAYQALADRIGLLIADGRVPGGSRLPAERELSERLGLSRSTIGAAYAELRASGYLQSVRGSGSIAKNPAVESVEQPVSTGVINFTQAALPALAGVDAAMQQAATQIGPYLATLGYEPLGLPQLRQAIADRYTERGLPTQADEIMVTSGALQALTLIARTLITRGDRVIVETPTYPHAADTLIAAGARLVPVSVTAAGAGGGASGGAGGDTGGWHEEALFQAFERTAPTLAYLMPDYQNPTGASMSNDLRRRLVAAAERSGTVLVADETTAELTIDEPGGRVHGVGFGGSSRGGRGSSLSGSVTGGAESAGKSDTRSIAPERPAPLATFGDVITLGSTSKTFWGGLRIGWIRASRPLIRRLLGTRASSDIGTPIFEQLVAANLVPQTAQLLPLRQAELRTGRDALFGALADALPEWQVPRVDGGLCAWVNLGRPASSQLVLAARTRGVLITAGPRFGIDGAFERFLRLPINLLPVETSRAVDALQLAWRDISGLALSAELPAFADMI
ncbi:aminotransferase-like domain-containing protein [Subtercola endophyticus]|uniref:aminotransferase-like domain-containing protein n=1 Tax=Subtercola endophyticus TaxID=2895559 RepID=UPI001E3008DF|nr:PLP-dependent aminotransferase family protein [Subtercola endophyticus]UFS58445.1 PLP-dependent aminotransferase family protein [Subtercola endophyticus]